MFEKESKNFDAVSVAIPDHNHAIVGLAAMQLKKHFTCKNLLLMISMRPVFLPRLLRNIKLLPRWATREHHATECGH